MAHIKQSRPDFSIGSQVKFLKKNRLDCSSRMFPTSCGGVDFLKLFDYYIVSDKITLASTRAGAIGGRCYKEAYSVRPQSMHGVCDQRQDKAATSHEVSRQRSFED